MARKRMIDPSIWADEAFGSLSSDAKIMFIGIISNADDEGRLPGNPTYLSSVIFPFSSFSKEKATKILQEVSQKMKSLAFYDVNGSKYIQLLKFKQYQVVNKPSLSKYPSLPEDYRSTTVVLPPNRIEENRIEEKEKETASLIYLKNIPIKDVDEFNKKYDCSDYQIIQKGVQLANYCIAHGKKYKNYKAMLENALVKDFGIRHEATTMSPSRIDLPEISKEERQKALARAAKMREELAAKFKAN